MFTELEIEHCFLEILEQKSSLGALGEQDALLLTSESALLQFRTWVQSLHQILAAVL